MNDRTCALAGAFQSATLVHQVAWHGECDPDACRASLGSLFELHEDDDKSLAALFGGTTGLQTGLHKLVEHLGGETGRQEMALTRYVVGLMHLERKLIRNDDALGRVQDGIERIRRQREHFDLLHETITGALGEVYAECVSPLGPRILVEGETVHLRDERKAGLIRALLLAGIRATIAWRQAGGSRFRLLLSRGRIVRDARAMLDGS